MGQWGALPFTLDKAKRHPNLNSGSGSWVGRQEERGPAGGGNAALLWSSCPEQRLVLTAGGEGEGWEGAGLLTCGLEKLQVNLRVGDAQGWAGRRGGGREASFPSFLRGPNIWVTI